MSDKKYKIELKMLEGSEVEISGEIPADEFMSYRAGVLKELGQQVEIDGFRKGHVPENIIIKNVGEDKILHEMSAEAISSAYPIIVEENKIDAIGRPAITITKIAADNPLGFKIRTAIMPTIKLPDYKKIAKEVLKDAPEPEKATEEEVDKMMIDLRRSRVQINTGSSEKVEDKDLPEFTDKDAQELGKFSTVAELREKIKENLTEEKIYRAAEKMRLAVMDKIIAGMELILPKILVESELDKMVGEMRGEIERMGMKFEDYLAHLKKSVAQMREDWLGDAERRVKFSLAMDEIANLEKLAGSAEEIEKEVKHLLEHYPEANPLNVKNYVEAMLRHNKVFAWLEEQGGRQTPKPKEHSH